MTHDEALAVNEMSFASLTNVHVGCVGRFYGSSRGSESSKVPRRELADKLAEN